VPAIQAVADGPLDRIVKDDHVNGWFGAASNASAIWPAIPSAS
jgi:hypothetical protein